MDGQKTPRSRRRRPPPRLTDSLSLLPGCLTDMSSAWTRSQRSPCDDSSSVRRCEIVQAAWATNPKARNIPGTGRKGTANEGGGRDSELAFLHERGFGEIAHTDGREWEIWDDEYLSILSRPCGQHPIATWRIPCRVLSTSTSYLALNGGPVWSRVLVRMGGNK